MNTSHDHIRSVIVYSCNVSVRKILSDLDDEIKSVKLCLNN